MKINFNLQNATCQMDVFCKPPGLAVTKPLSNRLHGYPFLPGTVWLHQSNSYAPVKRQKGLLDTRSFCITRGRIKARVGSGRV